jgi:hypothetical protein
MTIAMKMHNLKVIYIEITTGTKGRPFGRKSLIDRASPCPHAFLQGAKDNHCHHGRISVIQHLAIQVIYVSASKGQGGAPQRERAQRGG